MLRLSDQGKHVASTECVGNTYNIFFGKLVGKNRLGDLIVDLKIMLTDIKEIV